MWNIEGIKNKLWDIDLIIYLRSFDIFALVETWDQNFDDDVINKFPEHCSFSCAATKLANHGRAMGGIHVFIKKTYKSFFTRINLDCNFAIFLKCSKNFLNVDKHVIISFVYLPPYGSTFYQDKHLSGISLYEKVQVGKDQEKAQSEKDSHSKNRGGKKPNQQSGTYTMKHIVSRMSSYFPNRWPLSYLN